MRALIVTALFVSVVGASVDATPEGPPAIEAFDPRPPAIEVYDSRALAVAVRQLEIRHGWVVTYEDPFYEYVPDLEHPRGRWGLRLSFVPRSRRFRFEYADQDLTRPFDVLSSLVNTYNASGLHDRFRLLRQGDIFHIVPVASRNADGVLTTTRSRLSVRITMEDRTRSAGDTLDEVARQVTASLPQHIGINTPGTLLTNANVVRLGARDEIARDVLVRALSATGRRLSWQLFCDPSYKMCALNLHRADF